MKCGICQNEIKTIDTILESVSSPQYDDVSDEWVICMGFLERCQPCGHLIGNGFGDVEYFKTEQEAQKYGESLAPKRGILFKENPKYELEKTV